MKLIGMLDSPYVRRVAISLQLLGVPFEHRPLSVFRAFEEFQRINPVVRVPTLVCDSGEVLMDSTVILDYAEALAAPRRSLMPQGLAERRQALRCLGLALAACEKSVQLVYERMRPAERQHETWADRVRGQMLAALDGLEAEVARRPLAVERATIDQAGVTCAVVWHFLQAMQPEIVAASHYPSLGAHSALAEALPEFGAAPHGATTVAPSASGAPSAA